MYLLLGSRSFCLIAEFHSNSKINAQSSFQTQSTKSRFAVIWCCGHHRGMFGLLTTPLKEAELTQLDALQREIVRINCCKGIYAGWRLEKHHVPCETTCGRSYWGMAKAFRRGATWFCNTSYHFKAPAWFGTLNMISFQNLFDGPRGKSDAHTKKYLQTSHN